MDVEYSSNETIESYNNIFKKFKEKINNYDELDNHNKLIYLIAGLGLSNSIHEKFIKCIVNDYCRLHELSNNKKNAIIRKYKSPKGIKQFVELLTLDLNEAFNLNEMEIKKKLCINSVDNLIYILEVQRDTRNDYLHGDFNFDDEILIDKFKENIIDFQQAHSFMLTIIRYSFLQKINDIPDISYKI